MKASVIIPNLNGAGWLRDSIESIWAQTEQDFELIVIDNGSTDESLEIAHSYCGNPRYHLIENSENTGFSHAVNQGIAMAKGEYMALFNNDAFAEPNWLEELLKTAESDPKIFAVSSLMLRYYEPELADDAGDYVTILGFACKRGDGLKASRYQKPCRIFSACGGILATALFFVLREPIIRLFISDGEVVYYGVKMLIAYMLSGPVIGLLFVNMNCMQSVGNSFPATILSVMRQGLLLIPLLYLLNACMGLNGVIYGQALTDYAAVILSAVLWRRIRRRIERR